MRRTAHARAEELRRRFELGWQKASDIFKRRKRKDRAADCAQPVSDAAVCDGPMRWVVDSGCSVHCTPCASDLTSVTRVGSDRPLRVADKRAVEVTHTGSIDIAVKAISLAIACTSRMTLASYEFNRKRKPNLDKYRVWGCKC